MHSPNGAGVHADLPVEVSCEEIHYLDRANGIACSEGEAGSADTPGEVQRGGEGR